MHDTNQRIFFIGIRDVLEFIDLAFACLSKILFCTIDHLGPHDHTPIHNCSQIRNSNEGNLNDLRSLWDPMRFTANVLLQCCLFDDSSTSSRRSGSSPPWEKFDMHVHGKTTLGFFPLPIPEAKRLKNYLPSEANAPRSISVSEMVRRLLL